MRFEQLNLCNFRVFRGSHDIPLRSNENPDGKSITLFGGLNGSGKTSILTAVRLLLLGKRALSNTVTKKEYISYLKQQINHNANTSSISITLSRDELDSPALYTLIRSWDVDGNEEIKLTINGESKSELTPEQVESFLFDLIPDGVGDLFFFDGEKIAQLAEDDTGKYLKKAAHKLLGIDVIDRLDSDLEIQLKQFSKQSLSSSERERLDNLESEKETVLQAGYKAREKADSLSVKLKDLERQERELEAELSAKGGAWAESRESQTKEVDDLLDEQRQLKGEILAEAGGFLPLSLASDYLKDLESLLKDESEAKAKQAFLNQLNDVTPDIATSLTQLTQQYSIEQLSNRIIGTVGSLATYSNISDVVVDLSDTDFGRFREHLELAKIAKETTNLKVNRLQEVTKKLDNLSINLDRAPRESELVDLYERLRSTDKEISSIRRQYVVLLREAKLSITKGLELSRQLEKQYATKSAEGALLKSIERATKARSALSDLKQRVLKSRVKELEEKFIESFRKLNRKDAKNISAKIDPSSFSVNLIDNKGREIDRASISAGEKQIFALAILEALAALSGRDLPLVIDTPLGRLDSSHRERIVNNYFPRASNQVIILSTDTEIDESLYKQLEPSIDTSYQLTYNEDTSSTQVEEGYFWKNKELFYAAK